MLLGVELINEQITKLQLYTAVQLQCIRLADVGFCSKQQTNMF